MNLNTITGVTHQGFLNMMNTVEVRQLVSLTSIKNYFYLKKASFILAFFLSVSINSEIVEVEAIYETPPVVTKGDAADDPAIWVNKSNPSNSIIFGTDKKSGIYSYNLQGQELSYTNLGNINNIDTRTINIGDDENVSDFTFLFASNRTLGSVDLWVFDDNETREKLENNSWEVPSKPSFRGKSDIIVYLSLIHI